MGLILSFATVGVSFLFRPLGAAVAGHYGDRLGRKAMLVLTLMLMGGATALIGLLPSAARIASGPPSCWCCCASCRASPPAASGVARH